MEQIDKKMSLPALALQYGTISQAQYKHIYKLEALNQKQGAETDFSKLLLTRKFATRYQIELLKLIQGYIVIKKQGEAFGKIAIEKGLATRKEVDKALAYQKKEFKRAKKKKLIGEILVETQVITIKQKNIILKEQTFLDKEVQRILEPDNSDKSSLNLSKYEKQFLQVKVLDQEFAASVAEKGLASEKEIKTVQKVQEESFEKENIIRTLGDIMVELKFLTPEQKDLVLKEQNRIENLEDKKSDQAIQLNISQDKMEAVVKVKKGFSSVTLKDIRQAIDAEGIKYGVYPDSILQCNLDQKNREFIAARQDFSLELIKSRQASYDFTTGKIDTQIKKKGEALAEHRLSGSSHIKKDLFGNSVEQENGYGFALRCSSGTRLSKDKKKVFAGKTGFPSLSIEKKIYIHPQISVLEDADLKYGRLESFANLNISGVLTGAYQVTAGNIDAREIRGGRIEAVGDIKSQVGITDSVITAQGDIYARYVHNSRIETFGNIYIENEIIDSQIFCSGRIDSKKCRVITSALYGKKGIELAGAGSEKTGRCVLGAGSEHHILEKARVVNLKIEDISRQVNELKEKKANQEYYSKKNFQKMVELKIFHDRAKVKKQKLAKEFKKRKKTVKKEKLKNTAVLIHNFEKRVKESLVSLKKINKIKQGYDQESKKLEKKIINLEPKLKREVAELQTDLLAFFEWARKEEGNPKIRINKKIFGGTILKGVYSSLKIEEDKKNINIFERQDSKNSFRMVQQA